MTLRRLKSYVLVLSHHRCRCGESHRFETLFGVTLDGHRKSLELIKAGENIYDLPFVREQRTSTTEVCEACFNTVAKVAMPEPVEPNWQPRPKAPKMIDVSDLNFD